MRQLLLATMIAVATLSGAAAQPPVNILVCDPVNRGVTAATSCMVGLLQESINDLHPQDRIRTRELIAFIYILGERLRAKAITEDQAQEALLKFWAGPK